MNLSKSALVVVILFLVGQSCAAQGTTNEKLNVAVFIYNGVELLDFSGPAEVFAATTFSGNFVFNVYTVSVNEEEITSQGFLQVQPNYSINNCPKPDIIVLPGGSTGKSRKNMDLIDWIKQNAQQNSIMLSVCTGAFLLGDAGILDDKKATTWYGMIEYLRSNYPNTEVLEHTRFVDNGNIVTTAGVSAGIDGALHLVQKLFGTETAQSTAEYMEYDKWEMNDGVIVK